MPYIDVHLFEKTGVKKALCLELEQGEGILECIKKGMEEHGLEAVRVEKVEGEVEEILINYFEKNSFKSSVLKDSTIMLASGNFKINYGELFGQMKIVTDDKPPMHGTLVRGRAKDGLKLNLSFIEMVDKE